MFDYEVLKLIWWVLIGVLLIGFALTDGFDMGAMALMPFVGKTDNERRVAINTIAPHWDGNQVWFITAGGALFAAWPMVYAVAFSGLYWAMLLVLFALFCRPVGFDYRSKVEDPRWRSAWDWALFVGGAVPALIFGVAMGNVLQGAPFRFNEDLMIFYDGTFFGLLNPFALLAGLVSIAMLTMHGAAWLQLKSEGPVQIRARKIGSVAALVTIVAYLLAGVWLATGISGYAIPGTVVTDGPSNPLLGEVMRTPSWFAVYSERPWIAVAPVLGVIGAVLAFFGLRAGREVSTLLYSKLAITGIISSVGLTMFPFILPSSVDSKSSLTVWNSSSSHQTLFVMLVMAVIFVPIILAYTAWVYKVLWGKVTEADINADSGTVY